MATDLLAKPFSWVVGYATGNVVIDNMSHDVHTNHLETENTRAELS